MMAPNCCENAVLITNARIVNKGREFYGDLLLRKRIDVIASDHAPHTADEKANPSYFKALSGLTLIDTDTPTRVDRQDLYYKCGWSPFEGHTFPVRIDTTWVDGEVAYGDGVVGRKPLGQRLNFGLKR